MMMAQKRKFLIVPGTCTHHSLLLLDKNILPPHLHASAGMNLQTNHALGEFRRRVAKLHDLHAVELRHNVIALRGYFEVVPLTRLQCPLAFCCGHRHPTAASAFIQPVRSFPLKRETHPPCGGAFATTATTTSTTEARKAPILLTVKSPSLLIEKSEGLAGRNLSQIQRSTCLFPSIALSFSECLACILSARWFPPLPDRGCTASSGLSRRTDKSASRADRSHRLHTPLRPYLPRHPSRK